MRRAKRDRPVLATTAGPPDELVAAGIREVRQALERSAELGGMPILFPVDLSKSEISDFALWGCVALCIAEASRLSSDKLRAIEGVLVNRPQGELF
jgi:hypothetical protein